MRCALVAPQKPESASLRPLRAAGATVRGGDGPEQPAVQVRPAAPLTAHRCFPALIVSMLWLSVDRI